MSSSIEMLMGALAEISGRGAEYEDLRDYLVEKIRKEVTRNGKTEDFRDSLLEELKKRGVDIELLKRKKEISFHEKGSDGHPTVTVIDIEDESHSLSSRLRDHKDLMEYQAELKEKLSIGKFVRKQMNKLDITATDIKNLCGIDQYQLDRILSDKHLPYNYPLIALAKLYVLLGANSQHVYDSLSNTHYILIIDELDEGHKRGLLRNGKAESYFVNEYKLNEEKEKMTKFLHQMANPLKSLIQSNFHRQSIKKIKKERLNEQIRQNKANHVPIIKDPIKDKLTIIAPATIAGKSTEVYLSEIQKLRERLTTYDTFGRHFKKALNDINFEAPALERRFGFKAAATKALLIDELYPYDIEIKTFVPVCKFLKFRTETLIPQLENTFLLLQLKKMGEGTTKEKLEKLGNLAPAEKRKWNEDKNRLEAWIRRLTPVISRELS